MNLARRLQRRINRVRFRPNIDVDRGSHKIVTLGEGSYGSWSFVDDPTLYGSTIISCGLGEDASFDVAFARRYRAHVVIVDPTPRAIGHFGEMASRYDLEGVG